MTFLCIHWNWFSLSGAIASILFYFFSYLGPAEYHAWDSNIKLIKWFLMRIKLRDVVLSLLRNGVHRMFLKHPLMYSFFSTEITFNVRNCKKSGFDTPFVDQISYLLHGIATVCLEIGNPCFLLWKTAQFDFVTKVWIALTFLPCFYCNPAYTFSYGNIRCANLAFFALRLVSFLFSLVQLLVRVCVYFCFCYL